MFACCPFYFRLLLPLIFIHTTCILISLRRTSAPTHLTCVLGTQETSCILIACLLERNIFDLCLPEFDKPWVIHLRETFCCSTNLCTWRPNTVYKNRSVRRHQAIFWRRCRGGERLKVISLDSAILSFCFLFLFSLVRLNGKKNKKISDFYLHASSNVFSVNALNTICGNPVEKSKLGEASFYDLFNTPALVEKICSDDIISLICDSYKDACDISNKPTESIPFKIPMKIVDRVMSNSHLGDGTVHPGDHLLFIHELCELFECAGISMDQVKRKLFSLSLKGRAAEWYKMMKNGRSISWEEIVPLFYYKFYPPSEIYKDRNQIYNFWPEDEESIAQA